MSGRHVLVTAVLLATSACSADPAPSLLPRRTKPPVRPVAMRPSGAQGVAAPHLVATGLPGGAAGRVAGVALASEALQIVNTFIALIIFNRVTGAGTFSGLIDVFASWFHGMGWVAYPVYAVLLLTITILPLMSAILFIVLAGTVFGAVRGTCMVSLSLSTAASVSAYISRSWSKRSGYTLYSIDPRAAAVDAAIASGPLRNSLLLVTLLRLSPVLPFTFSNYLAGLTSLPLGIVFLGTLLGTLPTQVMCLPSSPRAHSKPTAAVDYAAGHAAGRR